MTGIIPNPNTPQAPQTVGITSTVTHVGPIDENFVNAIINIVNSFDVLPDELIIKISSGGGTVMHGITAYNYLKQLPCTVHTHNMGEVTSAAILPYLAGSIRTADDVSKFMFHPITVEMNGSFSSPRLQETLSMIEQDIHNYARIVSTEVPALMDRIEPCLRHETLVLNAIDAAAFGVLTPAVI